MSLLFFFKPPDDLEGVKEHYFKGYYGEEKKIRKKKEYKVVMYGKTAKAEPINLSGFSKELFELSRKIRRQEEEELLILHLINEGEL